MKHSMARLDYAQLGRTPVRSLFRYLLKCLCLVSLTIPLAVAQTPAERQCAAYVEEMAQIQNALDQKYGDQLIRAHSASANSGDHVQAIRAYRNDPLSLRFRVLIEKFRPSPGFECNFWTREYGPLAR